MSKRKVKVKKIGFIVIILLLFILGFFIYIINLDNNKNIINKHYSSSVITVKDTKLYNKDNNSVGTVKKNVTFNIESNDNGYFKIKDYDYYLYYEDVKKISKNNKIMTDYIPFNLNVKLDNTKLFLDDKEVISINNSIDTPIIYQDDKYYYIKYFDKIYGIIKEDNITYENNNTDEVSADKISIIHFERIDNDCSGDVCINKDSFNSIYDKLSSEYNLISLNDYLLFRSGFVRLREKSILLTTNDDTSLYQELFKDNKKINLLPSDRDYDFLSLNRVSTPNDDIDYINRYQVKSYTSLDDVVRMANGEEVIDEEYKNSNIRVPVLNYHFFYGTGESCTEGICLHIDKFREQLNYLRDSGFTTLTMHEFMRFMYGEIDIPEKSVLITVDDGALGTGKHNGNKLIPILEEYKMNATLFLITGWWGIDNYISPYLDIQSHTHDMHQYGTCGRGQINCFSYEDAFQDLKNSISVVENKDSFCFPFYSYSDQSLKVVQDSGFKLAFVGGSRKAKRSDDKFLIPRYPIHSDITLAQFKNMVD